MNNLESYLEKIEQKLEAASPGPWPSELHKLIAVVRALDEAFEYMKEKIEQHQAAYCEEIFPNYDLTKGDKPSIDQVSGAMGRHMCKVFLKYHAEASAKAAEIVSEI